MYEKNPTIYEKAQESFFLQAERSLLKQQARGSLARVSLARVLGSRPLPGESPEELEWLGIEDRHLAEEGHVELRSGDKVWFKHIDDLTREDRPARIEAENVRTAWLIDRLKKEAEGTGRQLLGKILARG